MTNTAKLIRMDDFEWPKVLNRVITKLWGQLKNTLVMRDFVDPLIQKRVITLEYWMYMKSKPVTESERMEDFLAQLLKFDQRKYQCFLEALLSIHRNDLVQELLNVQKGKSKSSSTKSTNSNGSRSSKKTGRTGRTDADPLSQPPHKSVMVKPKTPRSSYDSRDGPVDKPGVSSTVMRPTPTHRSPAATGQNQDFQQVQPSPTPAKQGTSNINSADTEDLSKKRSATDKLPWGIGTADNLGSSTAPASTNKEDRKQTKANNDQQNSTAATAQVGTVKSKSDSLGSNPVTEDSTSPHQSLLDTIRDSDSYKTISPSSVRSTEELLEQRERQLNSRESELQQRESLIQEKEQELQRKESELITRENTLSTLHGTTAESLETPIKMFRELQLGTQSASSTTDSAVLADVRAQFKEINCTKGDIESEHTNCNTPQEEYVKLKDFKSSQNQIEGLREELKTDRSDRKAIEEKVDNLQVKVEDLKQEISELQINIDKLKTEKEETKTELTKELAKLKGEMKNNKESHDETIVKIKQYMKAKDEECVELKANIEDVVKTATDLEERVEILENEKTQQEQKLLVYQKEITFLRKELEAKETEINDLKNLLEQTENEKEELIEDLAELKKDVSKLKAEKKQLECDRKTLLGRCAKPQWSNSTRQTTFKK